MHSIHLLDWLKTLHPLAISRSKLAAFIAWGLLLASMSLLLAQAQSDPSASPASLAGAALQPLSLTDRQRYGFVVVSPPWSGRFDVTQLHAGWFVDYTRPACLASPEGMDRALGISVADYTTIPPWLGSLVDNHPGTTWLIGNEPDGWLDSRLPEQYAHDYHELYEFIKGRDATARIAAANIVQPTPARLAWLDEVLVAYQQAYSQPLPVDVWAIHNMILTEVEGWGCGIPPGIDPALGISRTIQDNDSIPIFTQQIWDFRQWMADRGYQGHPLIISEYGVLMPMEYGFTADRVNSFMSATFDWMATVTDAQLGVPSDGNRLVQRWAWYSLDDQMWDWQTGVGFNGNLFDPDSAQITVFGEHFATHTNSFPPLSYVDLDFSQLWTQPPPVLPGPTGTVTLTLSVEVHNAGTVDSGSFRIAGSYDGPVSGSLDRVVSGIPEASSRWISFTLPDLPVGGYSISGMIDADHQVIESAECNNSFSGMTAAPAYRVGLPLVVKQYTGVVHEQRPEHEHIASEAVSQGFTEWLVPTPDSYPAQIAINPADGIVWISERDGNRIARFDPQTEAFAEYTIPMTGSQPWGLAVDAAGDVWFAEMAGNQIGRFDPQAETFVEYTVPTAASEPRDVAVEGNGNIWFTERAGNKIGKLEPGIGAVTEYTAGLTLNARPSGLAIYGTRAWFAETQANQLGRVTLATGAIAETPPITTPNSLPEDVVIDLAGYPWVTEAQGNKIAIFRVSTIASFVQYTVPTPASEPYGMAVTSDGRTIWFTERAGNKLGHFDRAFTEFPLPTPASSPTGIALDSAGCAWYTASTANRIGRFCPVHVFLPVILKNQ